MLCVSSIFFFKQKTAYEMRISDWSSDVCSSDLCLIKPAERQIEQPEDDRERHRNDDFHPLGRAHQKFELAGIGYADARGQFDLARDHRLYVGHKRLQIAPAAIDIDPCHRACSPLVCRAALDSSEKRRVGKECVKKCR